ncbi:PREDICTED: uncharacterized protein LOC106815175 [Priapulus caudatus]|uniref:Uncharacterized protein LOC106815175 n=1 Tax=Priapulus caudatus TaxID=37621 RepID=A0ABM1ESC1_PRICU|nr:PREDICTED: uncharacterized protein LOC106815175 [Priapulus caudatus]
MLCKYLVYIFTGCLGVAMNMTTEEWCDRMKTTYNGKNYTIVRVKEHKTAATQLATFAIDDEQEMWFQTYYTTTTKHSSFFQLLGPSYLMHQTTWQDCTRG